MAVTSVSIYDCRNARLDGTAIGLDTDQMRKAAPSIFAVDAHASRSERFKPIATIDILNSLKREGFVPVAVKQGNSRDASKRDFTKHLIRLRRIDGKSYNVGDTIHEIVLKNANDGTACYELFSGLFRVRCLNSLVSMSDTLDCLKIYHKGGDIAHRVVEGTYKVLANSERALAAPDQWSRVAVSKDVALNLATTAHEIRFADAEGNVTTPIQPQQLLVPRRAADTEPNLWTVFNVVQENCVKGGLSAMGTGTNGKQRQFSTKDVKGIDQDVRLNAALFRMGERMHQLLAA